MKLTHSCCGVLSSAMLLTATFVQSNEPFKQMALLELDSANKSIAELCTEYPVGNFIISVSKPATLVELNVHRHVGDDVVYPLKENIQDALSRQFSVDVAGEYCVMLMNQQAAPHSYHVDVVVIEFNL